MLSEEELSRYKKLIAHLEREKDQATGALKQLEKTVKKEFGVKLNDAAKLLKKLEKEYETLERKFIKDFNSFVKQNRKYLAKLEGVDPKILRPIPLPERTTKTAQAEKKETESGD